MAGVPSSNTGIFKRCYHTLGDVGSVAVRRKQMKLGLFAFAEASEMFGHFVVTELMGAIDA